MRKQEPHPRTEILNRQQKNLSKNARYEALRWLVAKFPKAFDNSESIHPLKSGIMTDILAYADEAQEQGISKSKLREAVVLFTRRIDYLAALKAQNIRIDLQGNPTESVTAEEAERAAVKLRRKVDKSIKNAKNNPELVYSEKKFSKKKITPPLQHGFDEEEEAEYHFSSHPQAAKPNPVIIKHKTTRQYDPSAVARLKEKLGLAGKSTPVE